MQSAKSSKVVKGPLVLHFSTRIQKLITWEYTTQIIAIGFPDGTYVQGFKGPSQAWNKEHFSRWNYNTLDGEPECVIYEISQWPLTEHDNMVLEMLCLSWLKDAIPHALYKKDAKVRKK